MSRRSDRRDFLATLAGGAALAVVPGAWAAPAGTQGEEQVELPARAIVPPGFPAQDPQLVYETVRASHVDVDRVRELVTASPALAKATWDWGFGDWESAIGAASHTGRRDIAELLLAHGARPNVFTFAMLGHLDAVRAAVAAVPDLQRVHGPHGITLLDHARKGGEPAAAVVAWLESLGGADVGATSLEVTADQKRRYEGRYAWGPGPDESLEVLTNRQGTLAIRRGERPSRVLHRVEENGFAPAGAPAVRIRFTVRDGRTVALTVHDPHPIVVAEHV